MGKKKEILQRIMRFDKMIFESRDGGSIQMLWNNITGKNFEKDSAGHRLYLERMKIEAGLPSGNIQLYLDYTQQDKYEEFFVPQSTKLDTVKQELINDGRSIQFFAATKFDELFEESPSAQGAKSPVYIRGINGKFSLTDKAKEVVNSWHVVQWKNTVFFELSDTKNGFTIVKMVANEILAHTIFAVIHTNSISKNTEKEEVPDKTEAKTPVKTFSTPSDVFKACSIDGNTIRLPKEDLGKELYGQVKTIIETNGGSWKGGKISGFIFDFNPSSIFEKLQAGEKVNQKQQFQFFETPTEVVNVLISLADLKETDTVLEPSAGQGKIADAVHPLCFNVDLCEIMPENQEILKRKGYKLIGEDFTKFDSTRLYNKIIANPPFSKNQDIDHVKKMYEHLLPKGKLVSVMGTSWMNGGIKKQVEFRKWLQDVGAAITDMGAGQFKESGTGVATVIVTIEKK